MVLWFNLQHFLQKQLRTTRLFLCVEIEDPFRGAMSYKQVNILGNRLPNHLLVPMTVLKSVPHTVWSVWRSKNFHSFNLDGLMFQVDCSFADLMNYMLPGELNVLMNTEQGYLLRQIYLFFGVTQIRSRLIQWLPAITILSLKLFVVLSLSRYQKNAMKSFSRPQSVKSPAWMKTSPFIVKAGCKGLKQPWVSETIKHSSFFLGFSAPRICQVSASMLLYVFEQLQRLLGNDKFIVKLLIVKMGVLYCRSLTIK